MEDETRHIQGSALAEEASRPTNMFEAIRRRITPFGGVDLDIPQRGPLRERSQFDE